MLPLILNIVLTVAIMVIFKYFDKFKVNRLQAIAVNYLVCMCIGFIMIDDSDAFFNTFKTSAEIPTWFWASCFTGIMFIILFNLIARTTQIAGVTIATVATKVSMIIPILLNLLLFGTASKEYGMIHYAGFLIIISAIILTSVTKQNAGFEKSTLRIILPIALLICTGLSDSVINYANLHYIKNSDEQVYYSLCLFGIAGFSGAIFALTNLKSSGIQFKNILWGFILGIPNYFSIYFLVLALSAFKNDGALVFPYVNLGVIITGTLAGVILFREKLNNWNYIGIILAILGIFLVSYDKILQVL